MADAEKKFKKQAEEREKQIQKDVRETFFRRTRRCVLAPALTALVVHVRAFHCFDLPLQLSTAQKQAEKATADATALQQALDAAQSENKALSNASGALLVLFCLVSLCIYLCLCEWLSWLRLLFVCMSEQHNLAMPTESWQTCVSERQLLMSCKAA